MTAKPVPQVTIDACVARVKLSIDRQLAGEIPRVFKEGEPLNLDFEEQGGQVWPIVNGKFAIAADGSVRGVTRK
jgi:hypothetical protein